MMIIPPFLLFVFAASFPWMTAGQFPAICNTQEALDTKTCCPNNCGGQIRGTCENLTALITAQSQLANSTILDILQDAPSQQQKGTADARYLWPTVVFEKVCVCNGNYSGVDCTECDFGWTGTNCNTRKTPVIRRSFASLSSTEKEAFVNATRDLKKEMGYWSVIVQEPDNYSTTFNVQLQNVSTYNFFVFLHDYISRDSQDGICTTTVNKNVTIDFAHQGPVFPVWHRRYMLIVEKQFQRIMNNDSFGFPYWKWEENDTSAFSPKYYGTPSNSNSKDGIDVNGSIINPYDWNTICDVSYWNFNLSCYDYWKPCNPAGDLAMRRPLQRGGGTTYLPNRVEVMIAIAAPSYDAADKNGIFSTDAPRTSFRSRLEGWNEICSAANCTGPPGSQVHMHNNVHVWVGGQMDDVPAAVNDPVFNLHHCNVDRVLESWIQRFANGLSSPELLPAYNPISGGHPGHNRDDYMVPFLPLITPGRQYRVAEEWGYRYDSLIAAEISDDDIENCNDILNKTDCPICDAGGVCLNCNSLNMSQMCPAPISQIDAIITTVESPTIQTGGISTPNAKTPNFGLGLGLGLGLGIPLIVVTAILIIYIIYTKKSSLRSAALPTSASLTKFEMITESET